MTKSSRYVDPTTRPVDHALHPIETGKYRIATPAIESFYELICRCLRYLITGALTYGPPRIGKTRAIEYLRLLLLETHPKVTTYHGQAEHKLRHAEGPFFCQLAGSRWIPRARQRGQSNQAHAIDQWMSSGLHTIHAPISIMATEKRLRAQGISFSLLQVDRSHQNRNLQPHCEAHILADYNALAHLP